MQIIGGESEKSERIRAFSSALLKINSRKQLDKPRTWKKSLAEMNAIITYTDIEFVEWVT